MTSPKGFIWYELITSDMDAAERFYSSVIGWKGQPFGEGMPYVVMNVGERGVAGIMTMPTDVASSGMPSMWVGYIYAEDVDAATESLKAAGGKVHQPPTDIPEVGRFSVVADPQGATFMMMTPNGPDMPPVPTGTAGHIGWHELYATDWASAFDFYAGQFGWTKTRTTDMGPMGTYQLFAVDGVEFGGMMNKPDEIPVPAWAYYFNVPDINAAAKRVIDNGGKVLMGPHEVPGGMWILQGMDPQGANFALTAPI